MAALGTDTGGSIRIPAGFNGIVGLKPTYGRVPKTGITTLCWSLDHVGPMTRTVGDAAVMLQAIAGHDGADVACAREVVDDYLSDLESGIVGLRLGIPQNYFREIIQNDVLECVDAAVSHFKDLKAKLVEVTISDLDLVLPAEFAILLSEAGAYHQSELRRVADLYGEDVRSYLELGELHLATHYLNAQRARGRVKEAFRRCFTDSKLDALIVPSLPIVAPKIGEETITYPDAGEQPMVTTVVRMVSPFNLSGQPVLSVPCGFIDGRLPVALGIVGRPFAEATVLKVGQAYERSTDWHRKRPSSRQDQELATPPRHLGGKLRGGL
jgi:aspartyl-tRNA(Asn)/glutamyl-tRNA(Gln) amidotransferase subunit A